MSPVVESAKLFLLAALAFIAVGALVGAAVHAIVAPRLARWAPRPRHHAWLLVSAVPALVAVVVFVAVCLPPLAGLVWPQLDHCPVHDGHAHLCFEHLSTAPVHPAVTIVLAVVLGRFGLRAARAAAAIARSLGTLASLRRAAETRSELGVAVVDTAAPLCVAAGLVAPRVLVSRAVVDGLLPSELSIVLAHERAHAERRHALAAIGSSALASLHLPGVARTIARELAVAAEQVADEEAARASDPVSVAEVLLKMERFALGASLGRAALAFGPTAIERRVHALLEPTSGDASLRPAVVKAAIVALLLFAASGELHHATESVLGRLAH